MSDPVIRVENLGKKYVIAHQRTESYVALRDVIAQRARSLVKAIIPIAQNSKPKTKNSSSEEFWALKDVSFTIQRGDRIGIIGRNGAGKSTLLKILSRITEPTEGKVRIAGRVASLLEVGTGFHPELTGRENIFLNGAILGMSKAEIQRKFDEIVAFAEIEKFLDTPVKRYSSGMYVRLAFAVAAHLEPEILIVDEVLAVGDAQFQEKCLGKMEAVSRSGRTVIFVSHNMGAIKALCHQGIFLSQGNLLAAGAIDEVIGHYTQRRSSTHHEYTAQKDSEKPYFARIQVTQNNCTQDTFKIDCPIHIKFELESYGRAGLSIGIVINNDQGLCIHHSSDEFNPNGYETGSDYRECILPPYSLAPGKYVIDVALDQRNIETYEYIPEALGLEVEFSGLMADRTVAKDWRGVCGPGFLLWR
ncbi:MAG: polysaccharide ABC transporter ATP-binding protein [Kovacikia sp.]